MNNAVNAKNTRDIPDCGICVRDTWHTWEEGKMLVFDDSYEHEVVNNTDMCRVVLLIRFRHPVISENKQNQLLAKAIQLKEEDVRRRYNPPLPSKPPHFTAVESRGMKFSMCRRCMQSGYTSIQMSRSSPLAGGRSPEIRFHCTCGEPIKN